MLKFALPYDDVHAFVREFPEKIATSGVYVKTEKDAEIGDSVGLLFKFRKGPETFSGTGEVVWIDTEEEAKTGKKGLVVRNIVLDADSQRSFSSFLKSSLKVADGAHHEDAGSPTVMVNVQAPQQAHAAHGVAVGAGMHGAPHGAPAHGAAPANAKKKWVMWSGISAGVLLLGFVLWYFALGGKDIIANMGIEYRDGRVTNVDPVNNAFSMGLLNQVSSDWQIETSTETQWIGVRGIEYLRVGDRIGLRYKLSDNRYVARTVTVKERVVSGTIGSLIDRTKGIFNLQDSKLAGSVVELSSELNDQVRSFAGKLKPGDVVESVYAVGSDGKNMVRQLVIQERLAVGKVKSIDRANYAITVTQPGEPDIMVTGTAETPFKGLPDWAALGVSDSVRVGFKPEGMLLKRVELVAKYVPPAVVVAPPPPAPKKLPPRVLKDVIQNADDSVVRFAFVFSRKAEYSGPDRIGGAFEQIIIQVRGTVSEFEKSELFLSKGPLRTVRFTEEGSDLRITFLANKGVSPNCRFETEGERIIAVCFR